MNRTANGITVVLVILGLVVCAAPAFSQGAAIKERMKERLPVITELKEAGVIGENNRGYLEYIGSRRPKASVVEAENRDRRMVYKAIADQQGTTVDVVEKHRAAQIEQRAESGIWLQDAAGKWYRK